MDLVRWTSYVEHRTVDIEYGGHCNTVDIGRWTWNVPYAGHIWWTLYGGHGTEDIVRWTCCGGHCTVDIIRWTSYMFDIIRWTSCDGHRTVTTRKQAVRLFLEPSLPISARGCAGRQMVNLKSTRRKLLMKRNFAGPCLAIPGRTQGFLTLAIGPNVSG